MSVGRDARDRPLADGMMRAGGAAWTGEGDRRERAGPSSSRGGDRYDCVRVYRPSEITVINTAVLYDTARALAFMVRDRLPLVVVVCEKGDRRPTWVSVDRLRRGRRDCSCVTPTLDRTDS